MGWLVGWIDAGAVAIVDGASSFETKIELSKAWW
jgi:hypothetical protein